MWFTVALQLRCVRPKMCILRVIRQVANKWEGAMQAELGDIVYVELPEAGSEVTKGETFGVVESVKVPAALTQHYLATQCQALRFTGPCLFTRTHLCLF